MPGNTQDPRRPDTSVSAGPAIRPLRRADGDFFSRAREAMSGWNVRGRMKVFFLQNHGFRTHLSTIRWAAGRLLKTSATLSREQRKLVQEIQSHTRILTSAFNAMVLLGRLEERDYRLHRTAFDAGTLLESVHEQCTAGALEWKLSALPVEMLSDRLIVEHILLSIFYLCEEAARGTCQVQMELRPDGGTLDIRWYAAWDLPVLTNLTSSHDERQRLGGTPGLMLSLATALAPFVGGTVELEEIALQEEDLITDGTVERDDGVASDYRLSLTLPVR